MTIELHQTAPFQETEAVMPGRRHTDPDPTAPIPELVFPRPQLDPALEGHDPLVDTSDYMRFAVKPGECPICLEILGGPECGCDWDAITAREQWSSPVIHIDLRSNG